MGEDLIVCDPDYGEEVSLTIACGGRSIRTNAGALGEPLLGADYVRVLDAQGREIVYRTHQEWPATRQSAGEGRLGSAPPAWQPRAAEEARPQDRPRRSAPQGDPQGNPRRHPPRRRAQP